MAIEMQNLGFSAAIDHHQLRPFIPEIISRGGGSRTILLPLLEKHFKKHHQSFMDFDGDDVDTSLSLTSTAVYDPMPLRCFDPAMVNQAAGKRKRGGGGGVRKRGRRGAVEDPPVALDQPRINNLGGAIFLYRKKLEESDVRADQNRLFVTGREAVMEFLTAEEAAAVEGSREGVVILGVDECGKAYNLVLKKWRSLNVTVINSDWNKMVAANGAAKGDEVQIWGFREEDDKPAFAVVFRRCADYRG